jgi:hypothetical protein
MRPETKGIRKRQNLSDNVVWIGRIDSNVSCCKACVTGKDKYLKAVETYLNNMLLGNQTSRWKEKRRQLLALDSRAARLVGWGSKMSNPHKNCNRRICGLMQRHCRNLHGTSIHCLCKHRSHRKACLALTSLQCNPLFLEMYRAARCTEALTLLTPQICTQLDCL